MSDDNEKQIFALFQGEKGIRMATTLENPRHVLQILLGVCEDIREQVAVEAVHRAMMKAVAQQTVQAVGNGVVELNGKPLL